MNNYRKKPVVIEAVQWFKMGDHPKVELYAHGDDKGQEHLGCIKTLESGKTGFHIVSVGDWIIKGVKGEYYACKPDIFALTYELASSNLPEEAFRKDAERYRWMRHRHDNGWVNSFAILESWSGGADNYLPWGDELDKAIDAAMQASSEPQLPAEGKS